MKEKSMLLKERWLLIQSGVSCQDIKIHNSRLYVKNKLCGSVTKTGSEYSYTQHGSSLPPTSSVVHNDNTHNSIPIVSAVSVAMKSPQSSNNTCPDAVIVDCTPQHCSQNRSSPTPVSGDDTGQSDWLHLTVFLCCHNLRSLVNKLSLFQSYVYSTPFNVYCITETWLKDDIYDNEILPAEYTLYRKDRSSRGGGVLIAVNNIISSNLISSPSDLELVAINLNLKNDSITICTVYIFRLNLVLFTLTICCLIFILLHHLQSP